MANTFSTAQISQMQTDLNNALSLFNQNTPSSLNAAMASISAYYQIQVQSGYDSYAVLANEVVTNSGVGGQTANTVLSYDGISYGSATSVHLMLFLAQGNLADITSTENNGAPASISEIETEHEQAYSKLGISIQYWGATAFANSNINWLGAAATAAELSNTINSDFDNLSPSVVQQNFCNVLAAGTDVAFQVSAPYLQLTPGNPLSGIEAFAAFDNSDYNAIINNLPLLFETKASFSGCAINLFNGLHALFPVAPISPLIPDDPNQFLNFLSLLGSDAGSQSGAGGIDVATDNSSVTLSATTSHNLTLQPDANSGESVTSSINNNFIEFTLGGSSSDLVYLLEEGSSFTATLTDQIVIASGGSDELSAGANNVLLIASDIGGTNIFIAGNNSSVSEILVSGSTIDNSYASGSLSSDNVFSFSNGTNVLIGDMGNNTFIENPTVTSATNIIWGGDGTSTYSLTGVIDILTPTGSLTSSAIERFSSQASMVLPTSTSYLDDEFLPPGSNPVDGPYNDGTVVINEILDPTSKDILAQFAGTYSPEVVDFQGYDGHFNLYCENQFLMTNSSGLLFMAEGDPEDGDISISEVTLSQYGSVYLPYGNLNVELYNFVNGDLGITFSGNSPLFNPGDNAPFLNWELAYPNDPGNIYAYHQDDYIVLGSGNSGGNGPNSINESTENIPAGATTSGVLVGSGGTQSVLSGGIADASNVTAGGSILVREGGSASGSQIENSGLLVVSSGGSAYGTTILNGGTEIIQSGGTETGATIYSGGVVSVLTGGQVVGASIANGGEQWVVVGATVLSSQIEAGGIELIQGTAISSTVMSGGFENVLPGGLTSGVIIQNGGVEAVANGSLAIGTTVESGGVLILESGTLPSSTVLQSGAKTVSAGVIIVESSGIRTYPTNANGIALLPGAEEFILSGGKSQNMTIAAATQFVFSGGRSTSAMLTSQGEEYIFAGGTASASQVAGSGGIYVESGGSAIGATLSNGGLLNVFGGGTANGINVLGGTETVWSGGVASGDFISAGGQLILNGGVDTGATIANGGSETVFSGAVAVGPTIINGGILTVSNGGTASSISLKKGGLEFVESGGVASGTSVASGAIVVNLGGSVNQPTSGGGTVVSAGIVFSVTSGLSWEATAASGSILSAGQEEYVLSNAVPLGTRVNSGGQQVVETGGLTSGSTISGGGLEVVSSGATAVATMVLSAGVETILAGGVSSNTYVQSGGVEQIQANAGAVNTTISRGSDIVAAGAVANSTTIIAGNEYDYGTVLSSTATSGGENVLSGGYASGLVLGIQGTDVVNSGGTAVATSILSEGNEFDYGSVVSAMVSSGGSENVLSGGSANGVTVGFGALSVVNSGGIATSTSILNGGNELNYATVISAVVSSGGVENALSGGFASGVTISSGGLLKVLSGGTSSGAVIEGGGSEVVASGATLVGSIQFSGSNATLSLGESPLPSNVISGFDASATNDEIVLANFSYSSASDSVTLEAGNALRLNLGGAISTLYLDPSQSFAGDTFNLTLNGQGQVVILDPPNAGDTMYKSSGIAAGLWTNSPEGLATAGRMAFLTVAAGASSARVVQNSPLHEFRETDVASFLGSYFDTGAQLSGTSVRPITVSSHQPGSVFGALTNQPLQSGTQVSTYLHSGFA